MRKLLAIGFLAITLNAGVVKCPNNKDICLTMSEGPMYQKAWLINMSHNTIRASGHIGVLGLKGADIKNEIIDPYTKRKLFTIKKRKLAGTRKLGAWPFWKHFNYVIVNNKSKQQTQAQPQKRRKLSKNAIVIEMN